MKLHYLSNIIRVLHESIKSIYVITLLEVTCVVTNIQQANAVNKKITPLSFVL